MAEEKKNPLRAMAEFYKEQVEEADEYKLADTLADAATKLFEFVKKEGFTPIEVEYLDGYFIFGKGTNSVVHFELEETPGWKYGIWWNVSKARENKEYFTGDFFAQYKDNVDKFKPSASTIACQVYAGGSCNYELENILNFIKDEPAIAFCKDLYYWGEYEYHSREEAQQLFDDFKEHDKLEKELNEQMHKEWVDFINNEIIPKLEGNIRIIDRGSNWHPRYEIVADAPFHDLEHGCYNLFDFQEIKDLESKWGELEKREQRLEFDNSCFINRAFHSSIDVY